MMVRSFVPVGQGGFCIERFYFGEYDNEKYTVVYDCGSMSNDEIIDKKNIVNEEFKYNKTIDALFISHFHMDHINMIYQLYDLECDIKRIFVPLVKRNERKYLIVQLIAEGEIDEIENEEERNFFISFISDPKKAIEELSHGNTEVLYISTTKMQPTDYERVNRNENINDIVNTEDSDLKDEKDAIKSMDNVSKCVFGDSNQKIMEWCLIPFNIYEKDQVEEFKKAFEGDIDSIDEIMSSGEKRKELKKAYEEAYKKVYNKNKADLNINSLVLYSGTCNNKELEILELPNCCRMDCACIRKINISDLCRSCCNDYDYCGKFIGSGYSQVGCLYLGDFNMKKYGDKILREYAMYKTERGCIQVPHHGSKHSFDDCIFEFDALFYLVLAGIANRYKHPHAEVVKKLISGKAFKSDSKKSDGLTQNKKEKGFVRIVTEEPRTRVDFLIDKKERCEK